ncbi:MAG: hypothetical protein AMJ79_13000, partial [Phycisphaerae bacterium SM23_30]
MKINKAAGVYGVNSKSRKASVPVQEWRMWICFTFTVLAVVSRADRQQVQAVEQQAVRIRQVRVQGNRSVALNTILSEVRSRAGAVFNEKLIAEDARRIVKLPQIAQVDWQATITGDQIDITFIVQETATIKSVQFKGNKHLKEKDLLKKLNFGADIILYDYLIKMGEQALEEHYHEEGYYFAQVRAEKILQAGQGQVVYNIYEGPKVRINKVHFENNQYFKTGRLKRQIRTKSYFPIFSKGRLEAEKIQQDCLNLQVFYHDEGFLDAEVFSEISFSEDQKRAEVTFVIEEGSVYRVKELRFEGNRELSEAHLREALALEPGDIYTLKRRTFAQRAIERAYGEEGYIYASAVMEPEFTEAEGEVNVLFKITENQQYYLGRLIIQGNTKTQDKVIRRSFDYYGFTPGGLYNTEAKDRGADQLSLGMRIFESVNVTPTGNLGNQRDALVTVTEADTGLLNFGVGVDTDSGVIGIFSIEQQNFDAANVPKSLSEFLTGQAFTGAGQRMSLQFMPGTEVTTGHLSFYEPYLFDQPYYMDTDLMLFRRW